MSDCASFYEKLLQESPGGDRIRGSAAVVPWRRRDGHLEVFWVRRAATMPFMGGWFAFPGGGLSRRDAGVSIAGTPEGCSEESTTNASPSLDSQAMERLGPDLPPGLLACTVRELFEETGLWLGTGTSPPQDALAAARSRLLAKEASIGVLADELESQLDASRLVFAGRWLTPPFVPMRFDNRFFLLEWPADEATQPSLEGRELDFGEWIEPTTALKKWRDGDVMTAPPILHILRVLAEAGPEQGIERLRDTREADLGPMRRIEFRPGLVLLPLRTPTLPPATHTNSFVVGRENAVLVDPATTFENERTQLFKALDAAKEQGVHIRAIWLSHHHPDHVGAVEQARRHLDVPVLAHPDTAKRLEPLGIKIDDLLHGGESLELEGDPPLTIRVLHTPGHTRGHLSFYIESLDTLLAGDLISTLSTIVIDPPEGDMDAYLRSLERMAELAPGFMIPSHGPATLQAKELLLDIRQHRLEREAKVLDAHRRGRTSAEDMVTDVYPDIPSLLHPVARRQICAHLERLKRLGEI